MSGNEQEEEISTIDEKHEGHQQCIRFTFEIDVHQYCEDCNEIMYFLDFTGG